MNLTRCNNGHFYDRDKYKKCPHCNRQDELYSVRKYEPINDSWYFERLIGEGSTSRVYSIKNKENDEVRAVKIIEIKKSYKHYKSSINSIMEKAVQNYNLNACYNIVKTYDCILYDTDDLSSVLIQMELLQPIKEYFKFNKLTEKEIIKLGIDICKALTYCHAKQIVHRDIKIENILVSKEKDFKLGDFGLAEEINTIEGETGIKGTLAYMPPEEYNKRKYDFSSDLYSLGMVLYRLMNENRLPFECKDIDYKEAIEKRIKSNYQFLPSPKNASDSFSKIILKACAYDKKDRYADAEKMRKDLENAYNNIGNLKLKRINWKEYTTINSYERTVILGIDSLSTLGNLSTAIPTSRKSIYLKPFEQDNCNNNADGNDKDRSFLYRIAYRMINWFLFTYLISLIPLFIYFLFSRMYLQVSNLELLDYSKIPPELLNVNLALSVVSIREIVAERLWIKNKSIGSIALFAMITVPIFSTVFFGLLTANDLGMIKVNVTTSSTFVYTIILGAFTLVSGTLIQIWEEL